MLAGLSLGQLGNAGVPEVVESDVQAGIFQGAAPGRPSRLNRPCDVNLASIGPWAIDPGILTGRKDIILRLRFGESASLAHQSRIRY